MAGKKRGRSSGIGLGNVLDLLSSAKDSRGAADEPVSVCVLVDVDAPRELALAVKALLVPERPTAEVGVWPLGVRLDALGGVPDAALVLCGPAPADVLDAARHFADIGVPVCMVAQSALDLPEAAVADGKAALIGGVAASDAAALSQKLSEWLVASVGDKGIALAAAFGFCRHATASALARRCALENAALGAVSLVPGSDFPLMTTNQAKLAVDMAACYGRELTPRRAAELAGVVGAGLAYRTLARSLVGLVPCLGAALKAGVGYAGTVATARALRLSFDQENQAASDETAAGHQTAAARPERVALAPSEVARDYLEFDSDGRMRP